MDLSAIQTQCGQLLNDPNNDRWSASVLLPRINLAMTDILIHTNAVKTREDLTPVNGTETVSLDSDTLDIIRIHIKNSSGKWKPLPTMLLEQLDFEDPNWQQRTDGEPLVAWYDASNLTLHLVPAPNADWDETNGLRVWEVQKPADLSSSTDVPFDSNTAMIPYHMAIVHYTVALCWMDDATPEALSKSRFHKSNDFQRPGEYEKEIKKIWKRFDVPEDINPRILWRPQGGRASKVGLITKDNPLGLLG